MDFIISMIPQAMGDILNAQAVVCSGTAAAGLSQVVQSFQQKRLNQARDIWLQEVRDGLKDISDVAQQDELMAIIDRYLRSAREGTTRQNLRILARVVAGQSVSSGLKANEFAAYASIIEALTIEEIEAIAQLYALWSNKEPENGPQVKKELQKRLIPKIVENAEELDALYEGLTRTGFLIRMNDIYDFNGFRPSKKLERLVRLARLQDLPQD